MARSGHCSQVDWWDCSLKLKEPAPDRGKACVETVAVTGHENNEGEHTVPPRTMKLHK